LILEYSNEELLKMYTDMMDFRQYEEVTIERLEKGELTDGAWHMGIGQEATQIGTLSALGPDDWYSPTHRCHGVMAVKLDKKKFTAECLCRKTGYLRGKGSSVHIGSFDDRVLPANGILGAGSAIAAGFALGLKRQGNAGVVVSVIGDSASNEGNFYEAMNLAAITNAPVVFVIENNQMGSNTLIKNSTKLVDLAKKAITANIPGVVVDGNDIVAVRKIMEEAIENARKGQPSVVEAKTCRYRPHSEGSVPSQMPKEIVEEFKKKDPIDQMEKLLREKGLLDDEKIKAVKDWKRKEANEAFDYALSCEYPTFEETVDIRLVYADAETGGEL
jgi:pyruvate dehydrogenase E1 component alpha subunit